MRASSTALWSGSCSRLGCPERRSWTTAQPFLLCGWGRRGHARQRGRQRRRRRPSGPAAGLPRTASGSRWRSCRRGWRRRRDAPGPPSRPGCSGNGVGERGNVPTGGDDRRREQRRWWRRRRRARGGGGQGPTTRRGSCRAAASRRRRRIGFACGAAVHPRPAGPAASSPVTLASTERAISSACLRTLSISASRRLSSSGASVTASRNSSNGLRKVSSRTISFFTSAVVLRICRIMRPSPDASSGSFLGPMKMRARSRMTVISPIPRLNTTEI